MPNIKSLIIIKLFLPSSSLKKMRSKSDGVHTAYSWVSSHGIVVGTNRPSAFVSTNRTNQCMPSSVGCGTGVANEDERSASFIESPITGFRSCLETSHIGNKKPLSTARPPHNKKQPRAATPSLHNSPHSARDTSTKGHSKLEVIKAHNISTTYTIFTYGN